MTEPPVTPELLLQAYTAGYFPMARSGKGRNLYWFNPDIRGALPLDEMDAFHFPRSLKKFLRRCDYAVTVDTAFPDVIRACAENRRKGREDTWINAEIIRLYTELHKMGFAHSVEVWENPSLRGHEMAAAIQNAATPIGLPCYARNDGEYTLIGGLYGVSIGGTFFGESMFSTRTNASKCALVHLVRRLQAAGYTLLDAQFENGHLTQFGFRPLLREDYLLRLRKALSISPNPSSRFLTVSVSNP